MARNNRSLHNQLIQRMNTFKAFGESRHESKKTGEDRHKIFSYSTFDSYSKINNEFVQFCKDEHAVRHLEQIDKAMAIQFIEQRSQTRTSSWSQQLDKSAINKIFDFELTQKDCGIDDRRVYEVKRGRSDSISHLKAVQRASQQEMIMIAKATGMRRDSMHRVSASDFRRDEKGDLRVHLVEKGGKHRDALVLKEYEAKVLDLLEKQDNEPSEPLFNKSECAYSKSINNHSFRAEYAAKLYDQVLHEHADCNERFKELNLSAVEEVSYNLGHNRAEVLNNYLYKF